MQLVAGPAEQIFAANLVKKRHSAPGPAALVDSFSNRLEGSDGFNNRHTCYPLWLGLGLRVLANTRTLVTVPSLGGPVFSE